MGCPIHIWAPVIAGLVPVARVARDRIRISRDARRQAEEPQREQRRWAPVGSSPAESTPDDAT